MFLLDIFFTGIGLSMDAVAVSICNGLTINNKSYNLEHLIGVYLVKNNVNGYDTKTNKDKGEDVQYHPPNCYDNKANIIHELVHILDYKLGLRKNKNIQALYMQDLQNYDTFIGELPYHNGNEQQTLQAIRAFDPTFDFLCQYAFKAGEKKEFDRLQRIKENRSLKKQNLPLKPEIPKESRFGEFIAEAVCEVLMLEELNKKLNKKLKARPIAVAVWDEVKKMIKKYKP